MDINKFRRLTIVKLCVMCLLFSSCGNAPSIEESQNSEDAVSMPEAQSSDISTDQSQFTWGIEVIDCEIANNLSTTQSAMQYGGALEEIPYEEKPENGNTFLLVQMKIEKQKVGAGSFEWDKLYVLDTQGNKFMRHPNDTFLENHNFKRIKSTNLTVGKSEGFICFEISEKSMDDKLFLVYDAPECENKILLNPKES